MDPGGRGGKYLETLSSHLYTVEPLLSIVSFVSIIVFTIVAIVNVTFYL